MKQATKIYLANISSLSCLICILLFTSSFVNSTSTSSISNAYEDSGGVIDEEKLQYKSSLIRNKRDVENIGLELSDVSSAYKNYQRYPNFHSNYPHPIDKSKRSVRNQGLFLSNEENFVYNKDDKHSNINDLESQDAGISLSRRKREGFFDISEFPSMMAHMVRGLGHGLPAMLHSMMSHGQHLGHQMASHFMPAKPHPTVHSIPINFGKPVPSGPSHSTGSGSYKSHGPEIIYGEWVPIGTSHKPKPRPPKPNNGYHPSLNNHVPAGPPKKPKPFFVTNPKPSFLKPRPIYTKPIPVGPPPSFSRPTIQYKPVAFPRPPIQPTITSIVDEHYSSPKPTKEEDSYGLPLGNPVGPFQHSTEPSFLPEVVEENPFTQPPYQTTFIPEEPHSLSGRPLTGSFVESSDQTHNHIDTVHAVEDWSDDVEHIKPIVDNTLYYNDLLNVKFKKKHDDGRKSKHVAVKGKEHHGDIASHSRVEKSAPNHGHEISSSVQSLKYPSFPSFPPLSGAFQVHHLPPISPVGRKKYRKRKAGPKIFQRSRSPESLFRKIFS